MAAIKQSRLEYVEPLFDGQRHYISREDAYSIDIFDDTWQVGRAHKVYLSWMRDAGYDEQTFIDLRVGLARIAQQLAASTLKTQCRVLKSVGNNLTLAAFQIKWLSLTDGNKQNVAGLMHGFVKYGKLKRFEDIETFCKKNRPKSNAGNNILDDVKGAYSEAEFDSIKEAMRLETIKMQAIDYTTFKGGLLSFSTLMACQLMIAIVRRPCQLSQNKWLDVLPVGKKFSNQRSTKKEWMPETEHLFSDVECLHIRTFKGKEGQFRIRAEKSSHRLEPNFSALTIRYYKQYEALLMGSLKKQGIELTDDERKEIMTRCPMFPESSLFEMNFGSKENLFNATGILSNAFHVSSTALISRVNILFERLKTKSDRIFDKKVQLGNNRLRHTVLSQGAAIGLSISSLSAITGVTENSVRCYIDLKVAERVRINQAFADNDILTRFGSISVSDLNKTTESTVVNEFDEEVGIKSSPASCTSCESKLGAPMGCYPCDNFRPLEDADHQHYLEKAQNKYDINKRNGNRATVKKLRTIILFINATIRVCEERKLAAKGVNYGSN